MKKLFSVVTLALVMMFGVMSFGQSARADEQKAVAVITKIEIAGKDAKTATVTLKDNQTGKPIVVIVNDDLTLDKFKDHRIVEGDEIRLKYETTDGKNISKYFRKTAGC